MKLLSTRQSHDNHAMSCDPLTNLYSREELELSLTKYVAPKLDHNSVYWKTASVHTTYLYHVAGEERVNIIPMVACLYRYFLQSIVPQFSPNQEE